jgi:predicted nucleic acid-binding protein
VTRCYLDTNFLFSHFRQRDDPDVTRWREAVDSELAGERGVISTLVLDELAYRSALSWLQDEGERDPLGTFRATASRVMRRLQGRFERLWEAMDELELELAISDKAVAVRARGLVSNPGLAPRDAFHAAHALEAFCPIVVSADADYDSVASLRRLGPHRPLGARKAVRKLSP